MKTLLAIPTILVVMAALAIGFCAVSAIIFLVSLFVKDENPKPAPPRVHKDRFTFPGINDK